MRCDGLPVPRQKLSEAELRDVGDASEHIGEPGQRIDVVELGRHDQRRHCGGSLGTAIGACEQPGFTSQGKPTQCAFGRVVGEADPAIVDEIEQTGPNA